MRRRGSTPPKAAKQEGKNCKAMKVNVLYVIHDGIAEIPEVIKDDQIAEACWENIARLLMGEDFEILPMGDDKYEAANNYLKPFGKEIVFYTNIEVNTTKKVDLNY